MFYSLQPTFTNSLRDLNVQCFVDLSTYFKEQSHSKLKGWYSLQNSSKYWLYITKTYVVSDSLYLSLNNFVLVIYFKICGNLHYLLSLHIVRGFKRNVCTFIKIHYLHFFVQFSTKSIIIGINPWTSTIPLLIGSTIKGWDLIGPMQRINSTSYPKKLLKANSWKTTQLRPAKRWTNCIKDSCHAQNIYQLAGMAMDRDEWRNIMNQMARQSDPPVTMPLVKVTFTLSLTLKGVQCLSFMQQSTTLVSIYIVAVKFELFVNKAKRSPGWMLLKNAEVDV